MPSNACEARAQIARRASRAASRAATVTSTGGQLVLVQAKGFSGEALDAVARDRAAGGPRRHRQPQARMSLMLASTSR